jgi:hypothetical protein
MRISNFFNSLMVLVILVIVPFLAPGRIFAHCDTLDGPVIKAAQKALETGNVNLILIWVQQKDENEIKKAFEKTIVVRKLNPEAKELADMYFFETLVRIHRAGEGAPYTGLEPAGLNLGPAIPAADKAIETGSVEEVQKLLNETVQEGLHEKFKQLMEKKTFDKDDVASGREYVKAYVEFVHYVEGLYQAAKPLPHGHHGAKPQAHGHHHEVEMQREAH